MTSSDGERQVDSDDPTVDEEGAMTPDQDSVEDANASGVNPDA